MCAIGSFTLALASYQGIPVVGIILAVMLVVYAFVMRTTIIGRHVYAVGGNGPAAELSGVKNKRVTFLVFVNLGLLSALAGQRRRRHRARRRHRRPGARRPRHGMSILGIGTDVQQIIKGLVPLAAVGFDVYNKRRGGS
jgi:putative multiple sugar transport system permease protein